MSFFVSQDLKGRITEASFLKEAEVEMPFLSFLDINNFLIEIINYNFIDNIFELKIEDEFSFNKLFNLINSSEEFSLIVYNTKILNLVGTDLFLINFTNIDNNYIRLTLKIKQQNTGIHND